jgi:helix-turn-helix protein
VGDQALSELSAALRELQLQAGEPSTRDIAGAIHYSHTTVAQVLGGAKCPKWPTLLAVITHLGGDPDEFKRLWVAARSPVDSRAEFVDITETEIDDEKQTSSSDEPERPRPTVLRLTRTTARDGTRSEELEIFDRQLAQEIIRSYLHDDGDASREV